MSVELSDAKVRAKDLQIKNLHRAVKINEETIENLRKDVLNLNEKLTTDEIEYKTKADELTKEAIACTYKLTVMEKVRKMELAGKGELSDVKDEHVIEAEAIRTIEEDENITNKIIVRSEPKLEEGKKPDNEMSYLVVEETIDALNNHKSKQESIHVLVARIVALEKEKEASLEKIDSLQSLINSMNERGKSEKEEKTHYINTLMAK